MSNVKLVPYATEASELFGLEFDRLYDISPVDAWGVFIRVQIKEKARMGDFPSLDHGQVYVFSPEGDYLGFCGVHIFQRIVGVAVGVYRE